LHGVIVLLVRVGSVGLIRARIEKDFEIVDGLHVRRADMVGAAAGSDDQGDLSLRGGEAGGEMHGDEWHLLLLCSLRFNFMETLRTLRISLSRDYKKKGVDPFLFYFYVLYGRSFSIERWRGIPPRMPS